ncbi:MAG: tetratricopeptide repeat protein [Burkholderiales bacterium]|nr:tetratricopeptide repeat protein [Burkholderiales bacterium]
MQDLWEELQEWGMQGEWDKIIKRIRHIKEEKRTPEEHLALACAYLNRANSDWNKRKDTEMALKLLEPKKDMLGDEYSYYLALAQAYYNLGQWGKADLALEEALDTDPPFEVEGTIREWLEKTEDTMANPRFAESFSSRVDRAWKKFKTGEQENLNIIRKTPDRTQIALNRIESIFKIALYRPHFQFEKENGVYDLTLPLHNSLMTAFAIEEFKRCAPSNFGKNWNIQVGERKVDFDHLEHNSMMYFYKNQIPPTSLWIEREEDGVFTVSAYCSDWDFSEFLLREAAREMMENLLITFLGEVVFNKYIRLWEILEEPKEGKAIPLADWPRLLMEKGVDVTAPSEEILNLVTSYSRKPSDTPDAFPFRQDILTGNSICMKFLQDADDEGDEEVDELEAHGASVGYIFYRLDNFEGDNKEQQIKDFREALKRELLAKSGASYAKIIGEAHGSKFDYVDIIAWDLPKVLECAYQFFSKSIVPFSGYQVFRKYFGTVLLTGNAFWMEDDSGFVNFKNPFPMIGDMLIH